MELPLEVTLIPVSVWIQGEDHSSVPSPVNYVMDKCCYDNKEKTSSFYDELT